MADFRRLFHSALDVHRTEGVRSVLTAAGRFARANAAERYFSAVSSLFPVARPCEIGGVPVPESVWYPHVRHEAYVPFYPPSASHVWDEGGVVESHHAVTGRGDDVVVVGGGFGVTAVRASRRSKTGSVTVFEASDSQAPLVRETLAFNDVTTDWAVHERAVGSDVFELYGGDEPSTVEQIRPSSLPECNTLELDCEGSELSILQELTTRPSALIVEIHPHKGGFGATAVLDELERMDYRVVRRYTHSGVELTREQLVERLHERVATRGADLPPVVAAVRDGSRPA